MISIVEDRRAEVAALCEMYAVKRLDLFGSAAGDGFDPEASDLDFVVSFERRDQPELFDRYSGLKEDLEGHFGRGVDLVTEGALLKDPDFAEGISGERMSLYAACADFPRGSWGSATCPSTATTWWTTGSCGTQ